MAATITDKRLFSKADAAQASLSGMSWAWFDQTVGALNAPTDKGSIETTDADGDLTISMANSTLTSGQVGTLHLYDPTGTKTGTYLLAVD